MDKYWKIKKAWIKIPAISILISIILYLLLIPGYADYTDRTRIACILSTVGGIKTEIVEALVSNPDKLIDVTLLSLDVLEETSCELSYYDVSGAGKITLFSEPMNTLLVLTPKLSKNLVTWDCYGRPISKHIPASCRK